jgi:hypothetical protein
MEQFTYTNSQGSIIFKDYLAIDGAYRMLGNIISPFVATAITKKGYKQDGTDYKYSRGEPRNIEIRFLIQGDNFEDLFTKQETVKRILNPRLDTGTLIYDNGIIEREMAVKVELASQVRTDKENWGYHNAKMVLMMTAYDPFFKDLNFTQISLVGITGGFHWLDPTFFEGAYDPFFLGELSGSSGVLTNLGDVDAPLLIEWTGAAVNPKLTLEDTGEFILLDGSLTSNERLIITTGYGDKNVFIETISTGDIVKDFSLVDPSSTFFQAPLGNSTISFSADSGGSGSVVTIKFKNLYT